MMFPQIDHLASFTVTNIDAFEVFKTEDKVMKEINKILKGMDTTCSKRRVLRYLLDLHS